MKISAQQLNEWLTANCQDAIKNLEQQGMALRFVEGPENYHQDRPSLAVTTDGVGFTFQMNCRWHTDPRQLVEQALDRAPSFQKAFADARSLYGTKKLPMTGTGYDVPPYIRGEGWDICNHQATATVEDATSQKLRATCFPYTDSHQDVAKLVSELCERQSFFERLRQPNEVLALVRGQHALSFNEGHDMYELKADRRCGFTFDYQDGPDGVAVETVAYFEDPEDARMYVLHDRTRALLSHKGIRYETNGMDNLSATITAKDLGMDPMVMNTMADMGASPLELLRFDAQKAEAETSAASNYLQRMDGEVFLSDKSQNWTNML